MKVMCGVRSDGGIKAGSKMIVCLPFLYMTLRIESGGWIEEYRENNYKLNRYHKSWKDLREYHKHIFIYNINTVNIVN